MFNCINTIIASIFNGTLILAPCILLVYLKFDHPAINKSVLISTVNCTLLIGSVFFILSIAAYIALGFSSVADDVRYTTLNRFFGPYWWAFWLVMAPGYLLPQILWFKKLRNRIISSIVIIGIWSALSLFVKLASNGWHFYLQYTAIEYLSQAVIYITFLFGMHFMLSKRSLV